MMWRKKLIWTGCCVAAFLMALGLWRYTTMDLQAAATEAPAAKIAAPAFPVDVEIVSEKPVQLWQEFSARLEAVHYVDIRPRVGGAITEIHFEDGQLVREGDVLFVVDPRPYQAEVEKAKAELVAAQNGAVFADNELKRSEELVKSKAISQRTYDERVSTAQVAQAEVIRAQAVLEQARIHLDYAYIKAPISGRVSRAEITIGNLVEAGPGAPLLTSIVSHEGIYAGFDVDEQTYLKYVRSVAMDRSSEHRIPVQLSLSGDGVVYEGFIQSFDNKIDPLSGTIRARAYFANEDGTLLPGMYATVKMGRAEASSKVLVSERAIGTNQDRRFVYLVGADNRVVYRDVALGEHYFNQRVVEQGLKAGDQVIVEGINRIRPGMLVSPQVKSA